MRFEDRGLEIDRIDLVLVKLYLLPHVLHKDRSRIERLTFSIGSLEIRPVRTHVVPHPCNSIGFAVAGEGPKTEGD